MITKCPECNKEISDRASTCPHCGFPLLMDKITAKAKIGAQSTVKRIGSVSQRAKIKVSTIAICLVKSLAIVIALAGSYWLDEYLSYIAPTNMGLRIFLNVFSSFLWAPALLIAKRCFGARTYKFIYILLMLFVSFLIFGEYEILRRESFFYRISSDQILYAIVAKLVGVLWLGLAFKPRNDSLTKNSIHADVTKDSE